LQFLLLLSGDDPAMTTTCLAVAVAAVAVAAVVCGDDSTKTTRLAIAF
jgi:hypothetical protein